MTATNIICVLSGSLLATIAWGSYLLRVTRNNHNVVIQVARTERDKGFAQGWEQAMSKN